MLGGLARGLFLRLASYAVLLSGFLLLYRAFEDSNILSGIGGGVAVLAAMWMMVGFRNPSWLSRTKDGAQSDKADGQDITRGQSQ